MKSHVQCRFWSVNPLIFSTSWWKPPPRSMTGPCTSSLAQWSQFCQQLTELMPEGKLKMCSLNQWVWQSIYLPVYLSIYLSVDVCIYLDQLQPEKARLAPEISKSGCWRYIYICILCNYVYIYIYTDGVFLKWVYLKSFMAVFKAMVTWGTPHLNSSATLVIVASTNGHFRWRRGDSIVIYPRRGTYISG